MTYQSLILRSPKNTKDRFVTDPYNLLILAIFRRAIRDAMYARVETACDALEWLTSPEIEIFLDALGIEPRNVARTAMEWAQERHAKAKKPAEKVRFSQFARRIRLSLAIQA